jgi:hypothetical protein
MLRLPFSEAAGMLRPGSVARRLPTCEIYGLVLTSALFTGVASDKLTVLQQAKLIDRTPKRPPRYQLGFESSARFCCEICRADKNYFRIF